MKRAAILTAATSLVGMVGAFVLPGAANAQSGSRLCGVEWVNRANSIAVPNETIIKLYEVPKDDILGDVCPLAVEGGGSDRTPSEAPAKLLDNVLHGGDHWERHKTYEGDFCEGFTSRVLKKDFEFIGNNFPEPQPHLGNICLDMNRSDGLADMEAYWLLHTRITVLDEKGNPVKNKDGAPVLDENGTPVLNEDGTPKLGDGTTQTKMQWFLQRG